MIETHASWAGIPLAWEDQDGGALPNRFDRPSGMLPGVSTVYVLADDLKRLQPVPVPDMVGGDAPPALQIAPGGVLQAAQRLPHRGFLTMREVREDRVHELPPVELWLDSVRAADEHSPALVELTLVDPRAFWFDRGVLTKEWNRIGPDGALESPEEFTEAREIAAEILRHMPGRPNLDAFPDSLEEVLDVDAIEVRAWGALPAEVLEGFLAATGCVLSLHLDGDVGIYLRGDGDIGEAGGGEGQNQARYTPDESPTGEWETDEDLREDRYTVRIARRVPTEVAVVGGTAVYTVAVDRLMPVFPNRPQGPLREGGQIGETVTRAEIEARQGEDETPLQWVPATLSEIRRRIGDDELTWREVCRLKGSRSTVPDTLLGKNPQAAPAVPQRLSDVIGRQRGQEPRKISPRSDDALSSTVAELWAYWQIPKEWQHLLPIRDRAETDSRGRRLPAKCEAFGHQLRRVDVTEDVQKAAAAAASVQESEGLQLARDEWRRIRARIALLIERKQQLERMNLVSVGEYLTNAIKAELEDPANDPEQRREVARAIFGDTASRIAQLIVFGESNIDDRPEADAERAQGPGEGGVHRRAIFNPEDLPPIGNSGGVITGQGPADGGRVVDSFRRWGQGVASTLGPDFGTPDEDLKIEQIDAIVADLESDAEELLEIWNPQLAIKKKIRDKQKEIRARESPGGRPTGVLYEQGRSELAALVESLLEEQRKVPQQQAWQGPFYAYLHVNHERRAVPFTVVDPDAGVIKLDVDPTWVSDLSMQSLAEGLSFPMPVRLIFGSSNRGRTPAEIEDIRQFEEERTREGDQILSDPFWVTDKATQNLVSAEALILVRRGMGTVVPDQAGGAVTQFTFTKEDRDSGFADTLYPFRLSDPSLRLLVGLDGTSNYEEIRARAKGWALATMGLRGPRAGTRTRQFDPRIRDGGHLVILGPRPVNPNGRISGMSVTLGEGGLETWVYFEHEDAPIPGVLARDSRTATVSLRYRLDPEAP